MTSQIINTVALGAALITLLAGLWQDWGTFVVLKRLVIAYLGFFFLGAAVFLVVRTAGAWDGPAEPEAGGPEATE